MAPCCSAAGSRATALGRGGGQLGLPPTHIPAGGSLLSIWGQLWAEARLCPRSFAPQQLLGGDPRAGDQALSVS